MGSIVTQAGLNDIAEASFSQQQCNWSQIAVGDGGGSSYEPSATQTKLRGEKWKGTIDNYTATNETQGIFQAYVPASVGGFMIREIGIFNEADELVVVGTIEATPKTALAEVSDHYNDLLINLHIAVDRADVINMQVDPNLRIVTVEYVDEKDDELRKKDLELEKKDTELQSQIESLNSKIGSFAEQANLRQLLPSGTQISDGSENLNTDKFMKVGNYYCSEDSKAQSLSNCPTTHGFMMEVFYPLKAESYVVRMVTDSVGDRWIQSANNKNGSYVYTQWDKLLRESAIKDYETRISALEALLDGLQEALETLI